MRSPRISLSRIQFRTNTETIPLRLPPTHAYKLMFVAKLDARDSPWINQPIEENLSSSEHTSAHLKYNFDENGYHVFYPKGNEKQ